MKRKKILFLIYDLKGGGAEKVLVNLVNNMNHDQFFITVQTLFDDGVNKASLNSKVRYLSTWKKAPKGISYLTQLFSPSQLYKKVIKEEYDVIVSYLEGIPSRIVSGCTNPNTKIISWVHLEMEDKKKFLLPYRSFYEFQNCYNKFNHVVAVSHTALNSLKQNIQLTTPNSVIYNVIELENIIKKSKESLHEIKINKQIINLVSVGRLAHQKAYLRFIPILKKLKEENFHFHFYLLGTGEQEKQIKQLVIENQLDKEVTFLGYQKNPYKFVHAMDLFICTSYYEGFSTAVSESIIVETPVLTTLCSGMIEILGENNEYGIIVKNTAEALYEGLKECLQHPEQITYYQQKCKERKTLFIPKKNIQEVEWLLNSV